MRSQLPRRLLLIGIALATVTCEFKKTEEFFGLGPDEGPGVVDTDAPEFFDPRPSSQTDVINTDNFMVGVRDEGSGVDFSTLGAANAMQLPTSFLGDMVTIDVSGLSDGTHAITVDVADLAGNPGSFSFGEKTLDRLAPTFSFTSSAPSDFTTDERRIELAVSWQVDDLHFDNAMIGLFEPGPDETCGNDDDVIAPSVDEGGHVENPWITTTSTGSGSGIFGVQNPVGTGGSPQSFAYCINGQASDTAVDKTGAPNPNTTRATITSNPFFGNFQSPPPPTAIKITVVDDQGNGIGDVDVALRRTDGNPGGTGTTESDGMVTIDVSPGMFEVTIETPDGHTCATTTQSVDVSEGETEEVTFACDRNGSISGTVTLDDDPFAGATIRLNQDPMSEATTDDTGAYAFMDVSPGPRRVEPVNLPSDVVCDPAFTNVTVPAGGEAMADFTCVTQQGPPSTDLIFGAYASTLTRTSATGSCIAPISGNDNTMVSGNASTNDVNVENLDPVVATIFGTYDPSTGDYAGSGTGDAGGGFSVDSNLTGNFSVNGDLTFIGTLIRDHITGGSTVCVEDYDVIMDFQGTTGSY